MIKLKNVHYSYPFQNKNVINGVSLHVKPGEVVLLTGSSGSGKSTLVKIINGIIPHYHRGIISGKILVNGVDNLVSDISSISTRVGTLLQTPEQQLFCNDVLSELAFAHEMRGVPGEVIVEKVHKYSAKYGIEHILDSNIFSLSEGEKQKVVLAGITSLDPKALILDEPTANLSHETIEDLKNEILQFKKLGFAILIADHRLYWLHGIADRAIIMKRGKISEEVKFSELRAVKFRKQYGLRDYTVKKKVRKSKVFTEGLEVRNLSFSYKKEKPLLENINLSLSKGNITALSGVNGVGKTTLAGIISGLLKSQKGEILLNGEKHGAKELLKKTGLVLQNMDHQLFAKTVLEEVNGNMEILSKMELAEFSSRHSHSLSEGQKQRLVIAATLVKNPEILILDEPTSGLDGKNMEKIGTILQEEAGRGKIVLVVTHDMEFIGKFCHEHIIMKK